MGTHPIFESDFDCLTASRMAEKAAAIYVAEGGTADGPGTIEKPFKDALAALIKTAGNENIFVQNKGENAAENPWVPISGAQLKKQKKMFRFPALYMTLYINLYLLFIYLSPLTLKSLIGPDLVCHFCYNK